MMIKRPKEGIEMESGKSTRKYSIFAALLLLTLLLAASAIADVATYVSGASIRVSMISQDPDPVKPGEYLELRWMVINMGSTPLQDVEFMLVSDYPFQLLGIDDGVRQLGTIQGHQKGEEGVILYYKVRIDEDASEGVNALTLMYRYTGVSDWTKLDSFDVRVQSVDAAVVIDSVSLEPERITPGNSGRLTLKLTNLADSVMKDINVKLDLTLETLPLPATGTEASLRFDALPFVPTSSAGEKRIPMIKPGESVLVSYDIMVYPSASSRVYKLPVIVTYKDEIDTEFEKDDIVGIVVGSEPDVYVVIDSSDLVAGKKTGKVSFKFVNKGVTDIKFLDVVLKENGDYKIISSKEEYIGNIDSDDFESVEFSIYLNNNNNANEESVLDFPLHITFKDANNMDYDKEVDLKYQIRTPEEKGEAQSRSAMIIAVVVVLMLLVWIGYKVWERRRRRQQK
jgi:hypothetical protein